MQVCLYVYAYAFVWARVLCNAQCSWYHVLLVTCFFLFPSTLSYIFNRFLTGSTDIPPFFTVVRTAHDKWYHIPNTVRFDLESDSESIATNPDLSFSRLFAIDISHRSDSMKTLRF
jgi:hypothetical protein